MKKLMLLAFGLALFSLAVVATETCGGRINATAAQLDEGKSLTINPTTNGRQPNVGCATEYDFFC